MSNLKQAITQKLERNPDLKARYEAVMQELFSGLELPEQGLEIVGGGTVTITEGPHGYSLRRRVVEITWGNEGKKQ